MKIHLILLSIITIAVIFTSRTIFATNHLDHIGAQKKGHLPLELTLEESRAMLRKHWFHLGSGSKKSIEFNTQSAIDGGEKLSNWIKKINQSRDTPNQIRLTSKKSRRGIPIEQPSRYGPKTISKTLTDLKESIPKSIVSIVYNGAAFTNTIPTDLTTKSFIQAAIKINRLYQTAVRWTTAIEPSLSWYSNNMKRDVRGHFHLKKIKNLNQKLENFKDLKQDEQKLLKGHLIGICLNNYKSKANCLSLFNKNLTSDRLLEYKNLFMPNAQKMWNSYFTITNPRIDIKWPSANPALMIIPFKEPKRVDLAHWLKSNVEDEFKTDLWNMELKFVSGSWGTAQLQFQPGVTPHVIGGNTIVMDANTPIQEYQVRWTIRHEFGHILRLPDCYVEFYDSTKELAINYQLDTDNLMCSRAGDFNLDNLNELKRVYFK